MEPVKCIFSNILLEGQHKEILDKYLALEHQVKVNKNILELDENETKNYFTFSSDVQFQKCIIRFNINEKNSLKANIVYTKKNKNLELTFILKKYTFKFNDKIYYCFETKFLKDYLEKEYQKKKFLLKINLNNCTTKKITTEIFFHFGLSDFEIVYNYNYKSVTLEELTEKYAYTNNEKIKASDLNYEFANYVQLEEEDFNSFYYIDSNERQIFIDNINDFEGKNYNFLALCGPFGCGKTVTLLKMINNPLKRSFYINLWTIFNLEIDEVKNVLKYEYVKILGENFKKENEKDEIILHINQLDSAKNIYDFISKVIISLIQMDEKIYYLIIDQYSSKYDENNQNIKKLKKEVEGTKIIMIICSSMNNYDVKENLAYSFSPSSSLNIMQNNDKINYLYVGCLVRLNPLKEPLKNESIEFKNVLSKFGNLQFYYYKLKETLRQNKDYQRFIREVEETVEQELKRFYKKNEENKMKIELAKIIYYIKEKEIFLYNDLKDSLLKLPLKFLEIKTQAIPIYILLRYANQNKNFELIGKIKNYVSNDYEFKEAEEKSKILFMNSVNSIDEKEFSGPFRGGENINNINIFSLEGLFPYIVDIFSKIIYDDNLLITRAFFSELSAQTQGGIIEFYLLEHIKYNQKFFDINISQFESIEVFVPNSFFFQNFSSRKKDTIYDYNEKENDDINKEKINLPEKNILIKQKQYTGKYYDFAILIYSEDEKGFYLILFQVSKRKINSQILYKEEHEIALNRVKINIEENFNIKIIAGYFCYIFTNFSKNDTVISFCEKYKIPYLEFSFEKMKFNKNKPFNLNDCLITKKFPFHNYFSILPDSKFESLEDNYDEIIKYKNLFTFIPIKGENENKLKLIFKINNKSSLFNPNNKYAIFGFFDKIQDFSKKFCIWYNVKEKKIYYYKNDDIKSTEKEFDFNDANSEKKEWVSICSKYKYKYLTNKDINNYITKIVNFIQKNNNKKKINQKK